MREEALSWKAIDCAVLLCSFVTSIATCYFQLGNNRHMGAILAGHYHVLRPLGGGGFGQTFLARDSHLPGKPLCVVKQFKPRLDSARSLGIAKRLFDLEAEILYRLGNHDQIPRLLAHFEQDSEFYLVQEYVEGWSLDRELTQHKQLSEADTVVLMRDILEVLAFVHAENVIHRDIKPSNLMRRKHDRKIVLIDFGAVKQVSSQSGDGTGQTSLTVAIGSPGYMPAEQQSSLPQFSSDVYAVGMVALQALLGMEPKNLSRSPHTGEIESASFGISSDLATILDKMVRYDYRQRYANAGEALTAVQSLGHLGAMAVGTDLAAVISPAQFSHTLLQYSGSHTHDQEETLPPAVLDPEMPRQVTRLPVVSSRPSTIATLTPPAEEKQLSRQEYRNRQALLSKVKHYWVRGVLETSLHDQVLLVLGLETRPDAVASPWNVAWEREQQSALTLPAGTPIIDLFEQLGMGRTLLILGEPGAGKTTTLLQLARDLLMQAEEDIHHLIPVVLNLASWSSGQEIAVWLVDELNAKYQVPKKISRPWVEQQQLLLLLDGLDEVPIEHREACVVALNQFQQQHSTEMVVCSRIKDYEALSQQLNFQSAIYLRSLTSAQTNQYLNSLDADLTGLKELLTQDVALQELAQSPLMLNMMVLAYQGVAAEDVGEPLVVEERRRQLFNAYIECMFRRRADFRYASTQTIDWLSWLAKQLVIHAQSVFLIEQIQPDWLPNRKQRILYRVGVVLLTILLMGVPFGVITGALTNGLMDGWRSGLIKSISNSLIYGTTFGLISGLSKPEVQTVETLKWSWREAKQNLWIGIRNGIPIGLLAGLVFGLVSELNPRMTPGQVGQIINSGMFLGLVGGFTSGIIGGLIFGVTRGLRGSTIETKTFPNQGIWRTLLSASLGGLMGGAIDAVVITIVYSLMLGLRFGILYGLSYGFCGGFIAGFIFSGGQACLKHFVLRLMLYRNRRIPWNYARFLNYAAEHIFLQRVGGGYIFIHRLVMEHFAHLRS